jgi:hypothetical protein
MKLLLISLALLLLCGCAVMDTSVMDTAEPLKPGEVKLETFTSTGLVLESTVFDENEEAGESHKAVMWPVTGLKMGLGIADKAEFGAKAWLSHFSLGTKVYLKYLFGQEGKNYYSIIPAFTYAGVKEGNQDGDLFTDYEYKSIGAELPILATHKVSEAVSLTAAARLNYNMLEYHYNDGDGYVVKRGPYTIVHGGLQVNARFKLSVLVLTPEVGVEFVPVVNGDFTVLPDAGLTLGLQF